MFKNEPKQSFDLAESKCNFIECKCNKLRRVPMQQVQLFLTDRKQDNQCLNLYIQLH